MNKSLFIFLRAFLIVLLSTSSIWFISNNYKIYAIIAGLGISLLWVLNVRDISIGKWKERIFYIFGGFVGMTTSLYLLPLILI